MDKGCTYLGVLLVFLERFCTQKLGGNRVYTDTGWILDVNWENRVYIDTWWILSGNRYYPGSH